MPRSTSIMFALPIALFGASAIAASEDLNSIFFGLQKAVGGVVERSVIESAFNETKVAALKERVNVLQDIFTASPNSSLPPEYIKVLEYDTQVLNTAATMPNAGDANALIAEVVADTDVKLNFIRALGAVVAKPGLVHVKVKTAKQGAEANGYLVRCNPRRYAGVEPMFIFNDPSSPTTADIPPGRYEFIAIWSGQTVAHQDAEIGLAGNNSAELTILIP